MIRPPPGDPIWAVVRERTHTFQNVRDPPHPDINAICSRCGLVLPPGPIIACQPSPLPPCGAVEPDHNG